MNYDVPFIPNTNDNKSCLQAAYGMIRKYFEPDWEIDWDEWRTITGWLPGKGTWDLASMLWFGANGYEVHHLGLFDYQKFIDIGGPYLHEALGPDMGKWDEMHIDIPAEQQRAKELLKTEIWKPQLPITEDIVDYLRQGYIVKSSVNLNALNNKPDYLSHALIIKGFDENGLILHDPGLPSISERHVPFDKFINAWSHTSFRVEKLIAIRPRKPGELPQTAGTEATPHSAVSLQDLIEGNRDIRIDEESNTKS